MYISLRIRSREKHKLIRTHAKALIWITVPDSDPRYQYLKTYDEKLVMVTRNTYNGVLAKVAELQKQMLWRQCIEVREADDEGEVNDENITNSAIIPQVSKCSS